MLEGVPIETVNSMKMMENIGEEADNQVGSTTEGVSAGDEKCTHD